MARFVFPLQPLLDARRRKEEEKQRAFASAKAARDENVRDLGRLAGALRIGGRALHECAMTGSTQAFACTTRTFAISSEPSNRANRAARNRRRLSIGLRRSCTPRIASAA